VKYLLLIYFDEAWGKLSAAERQEIYWGQMRLSEQLTADGKYLGGNPLHPTSTATSVRVRDGPFAETREQLGGYMLIDVPDLDEAIAIAAAGPVSQVGVVEVRPVREGPPA